jgi:histidine decarboxylase
MLAAGGCRPPVAGQYTGEGTGCVPCNGSLNAENGRPQDKDHLLGYPVNMNTPPEAFFEWRRQLNSSGMGCFAFNNVGNPFEQAAIPYNSHDYEKALILRFAQLYDFPENDVWGFLSHSGTDSNMHGMYIGRTVLRGNTGVWPKCYFTREAHYSVQILADLLGMEPVYVQTMPDASMDCTDLKEQLSRHPDHPALVVATIGTTFKGGIDPIDCIRSTLQGKDHYIHLDAALFGGYLPHTVGAGVVQQASQNGTGTGRYDSIAVSCHKFFGFPAPAGLFITTRQHYDTFSEYYSRIHNPEYIGHVPGTITCSRDGVKPGEFYYFSQQEALALQRDDADTILTNTAFLMREMNMHFGRLEPVRTNDLSNTIYFHCPPRKIVEKYSLATMHLSDNAKEYAHIVVMPHAGKDVLTEFLTDLQQEAWPVPG